MRAFLTVWKNGTNLSEQKMIDCPELIIKDGPKIDLDGEECQFFHVIAADGIYHNVATIEVI